MQQHTGHSARKERILHSRNYRNGAFRNFSSTPMKAENVSWFKIMSDGMRRPANTRPAAPLPSMKTDLRSLPAGSPVIVWFGHSSYFIRANGHNILVDPVFSGYASPFRFLVRAFPGADVYTADDLPDIDLLIITHNHYDHLDKKAIRQLSARTRAFYTALGVGRDLEHCGVAGTRITEMDWWETVQAAGNITLTATPARHFSGRALKRNGSLWASFVLDTGTHRLYLGGDSGYDAHFREIGDRYGPFDIALLECGQYNTAWPLIHMMPEDTVQAALDLRAKVLMPVHWGKFALAYHAWNEPVTRVVKSAEQRQLHITTPLIGEPVVLGSSYPRQPWWQRE